MSKHTPGPWIVDDNGSYLDIGVPYDGEFFKSHPTVCMGVMYSQESNARLIAAAPDFYAMAEMVLAWWDKHQYDTISGADGDEWNVYDDEPDFVTAARAAIAKATGDKT